MPKGRQRITISNLLRFRVMAKCNYTCVYCGKKGIFSNHYKPKAIEIDIRGKEISFEFDHVIPVSKKGKTNFKNLVLACRKCNRKKKDKWLEKE